MEKSAKSVLLAFISTSLELIEFRRSQHRVCGCREGDLFFFYILLAGEFTGSLVFPRQPLSEAQRPIEATEIQTRAPAEHPLHFIAQRQRLYRRLEKEIKLERDKYGACINQDLGSELYKRPYNTTSPVLGYASSITAADSPTLVGVEVYTQVAVVLHLAFRVATFRQAITVINDKHSDILVVGEVRKKFGCDEEVLPAVFGARHLNQFVVHSALILDIHALSIRSVYHYVAWSVT